MPSKMWVEMEMDKYFHPALNNGCGYLAMLGLKLTHVDKKGPW